MKSFVPEIKAIPPGGSITRKFASGKEIYSYLNTVQYVKRVYPREDGRKYSCSTNWDCLEVTVKLIDP